MYGCYIMKRLDGALENGFDLIVIPGIALQGLLGYGKDIITISNSMFIAGKMPLPDKTQSPCIFLSEIT